MFIGYQRNLLPVFQVLRVLFNRICSMSDTNTHWILSEQVLCKGINVIASRSKSDLQINFAWLLLSNDFARKHHCDSVETE